MGGFTARFEGLKELDAKLAELKTTTATKVLRQALTDGGKVFQQAVQERAPMRPDLSSGTAALPGVLKQDIEIHFGRDAQGLPAVIVSPGRYTAYFAKWVEYGHRLVRGGGLSLKRGKMRGSGHAIGNVQAHPFIRPAYEASRERAVEAACKSLASGIEKAAKK